MSDSVRPPETAAHRAPPSLGFSRQEHWSGLLFPSPTHESEKGKWSRSVVSDSSDPMDCSLPGSSVHEIFQAKVLEWGQWRRCGFNPWSRKIPWRRKWQPTPLFLPGKSHEQRSLGGLQSMGSQWVRHNLATEQPPPPEHLYLVLCLERADAGFNTLWSSSQNYQ